MTRYLAPSKAQLNAAPDVTRGQRVRALLHAPGTYREEYREVTIVRPFVPGYADLAVVLVDGESEPRKVARTRFTLVMAGL